MVFFITFIDCLMGNFHKSPRYPLINRTPKGMVLNHSSNIFSFANEANGIGTKDQFNKRKLKTIWSDDNNFFEAVIIDYRPVQYLFDPYTNCHGHHALLYNKNMPKDSFEWVSLKEVIYVD
ncbi:hypothetical protein R6Q57_021290 [Mikania cordata]